MMKRWAYFLGGILSAASLLMPLAFAAPPTMVHIHYAGTLKIKYKYNHGELTSEEFYKKACDVRNQQEALLRRPQKPFRVSGGSFNDLEKSTEDVYISPENSFYAKHVKSYAFDPAKAGDACDIHIVPRLKIVVSYYKQLSTYEFDSNKPVGSQWARAELPNKRDGKMMVGLLSSAWNIQVTPTGKKDTAIGLECEIVDFAMGKQKEMSGTGCLWRSQLGPRFIFLGNPLELPLRHFTRMGTTEARLTAESVNLNEAYAPRVFTVPKDVLNMPFYADEPHYTKSEESDFDCNVEKGETGVDPCSGPENYAKWCSIIQKSTGKNACVVEEDGDE